MSYSLLSMISKCKNFPNKINRQIGTCIWGKCNQVNKEKFTFFFSSFLWLTFTNFLLWGLKIVIGKATNILNYLSHLNKPCVSLLSNSGGWSHNARTWNTKETIPKSESILTESTLRCLFLQNLRPKLTSLKKVIGCWPRDWGFPMLQNSICSKIKNQKKVRNNHQPTLNCQLKGIVWKSNVSLLMTDRS